MPGESARRDSGRSRGLAPRTMDRDDANAVKPKDDVTVGFVKRHRLKLLAIGGAAAAGCIGGSVYLLSGAIWSALLVALGFGMLEFSVLVAVWNGVRRANKLDRYMVRLSGELARVRVDVSRVVYRTEPLRHAVGSITRTRNDVAAAAEALEKLRLQVQEVADRSEQEEDEAVGRYGLFSPMSFPSYAPPVPSVGAPAGRAAAGRVDDPQTRDKYAALLSEPCAGGDDRPLVLTVASSPIARHLHDQCRVVSIRPEVAVSDLLDGASYLVIDDAAFESGPWFGADSAEGTDLYMRLRDLIHAARARRVLPIFVRQRGCGDHFTGELESLCRLVLRAGETRIHAHEPVPAVVRSLADNMMNEEPTS